MTKDKLRDLLQLRIRALGFTTSDQTSQVVDLVMNNLDDFEKDNIKKLTDAKVKSIARRTGGVTGVSGPGTNSGILFTSYGLVQFAKKVKENE